MGLVLFLGAKGPGLEANVPHTLLQQVGGSRQVEACRTGESQGQSDSRCLRAHSSETPVQGQELH